MRVGGIGFEQGLFGQALSFNGDESRYAQRPIDDQVFDFGGSDFTVQTWVNFNTTSGEQLLIEKWVDEGFFGWTLTKLANDSLVFGYVGAFVSSQLNISTEVFHQFAVSRSGTDVRLFFDGQLVGSVTAGQDILDTSKPLLVGARDGYQYFPINGQVDEVAIWSRALTGSEIAEIYNNGEGLVLTQPPTPIVGTPQDDVLTGTNGSNVIKGLAGDDVIQGLAGADSISAGEGRDLVSAGDGDDSVTGDGGNDDLLGGNGNDTLDGGAGLDRILGEAGDDTLLGSSGNDILDGGLGNDSIDGGAGNDTLLGASGHDRLYGGDGNDTLAGGRGKDYLYGGSGNDVFRYTSVDETNPTGGGYDFIAGFDKPGRELGDRIDLSAIDARPDLAGDQAFTLVRPAQKGWGRVWVFDDSWDNATMVQGWTGPTPPSTKGDFFQFWIMDGPEIKAAHYSAADFIL